LARAISLIFVFEAARHGEPRRGRFLDLENAVPPRANDPLSRTAPVMLTSILLCLGVLPSGSSPIACLHDARSGPSAFSASTNPEREPIGSLGVEAADEESEEEEWQDRSGVIHPLDEPADPRLTVLARRSNGTPHLEDPWDPRRSPRSPPLWVTPASRGERSLSV